MVETPRGRNPWVRCVHCQAYYLVASFDLVEEVAHTETLPWGQLQAGLALNTFKRRMFLAVLEMIGRHRPPPAQVLDVGCSFGGFAIEATAAGYVVHGMDITPAAVDHVRSLGLTAECCAHPAALAEVEDGAVDVVTCLDCHSLWSDQPDQLRAIRAKLRPGGLLVLRVVDKSWLFTLGRAVAVVAPRAALGLMRQAVNDNRFSMPVHTQVRILDQIGFDVREVSVGAAVHSDQSRMPARAAFRLGAMVWPLTHRNVGPGAVIVAVRRP